MGGENGRVSIPKAENLAPMHAKRCRVLARVRTQVRDHGCLRHSNEGFGHGGEPPGIPVDPKQFSAMTKTWIISLSHRALLSNHMTAAQRLARQLHSLVIQLPYIPKHRLTDNRSTTNPLSIAA